MNTESNVHWNPWLGCHKFSIGCERCYMFAQQSSYGKNPDKVAKTKSVFDLPVKRNRQHEYKYPSGTNFAVCFSSDFFIEEADDWRDDVWRIIKERSDCNFVIITKRVNRIKDCLPLDWDDGWDNVIIYVSMETQSLVAKRYPVLEQLPIKHKGICIAPIKEAITLEPFIEDSGIDFISVGGESGNYTTICKYEWVQALSLEAIKYNKNFHFHQTGSRFSMNGKIYRLSVEQEYLQASKAGLNRVKC